jgi:hypothetical protein
MIIRLGNVFILSSRIIRHTQRLYGTVSVTLVTRGKIARGWGGGGVGGWGVGGQSSSEASFVFPSQFRDPFHGQCFRLTLSWS